MREVSDRAAICGVLSGPSSLLLGTSPAARKSVLVSPQPKSAAERIGVVASARMRRQRFELPDVASPNYRIVGLQRGDEARHDVGNVASPFLLAVAFQSSTADIVLIGALLVG